MSKKEKKDFNPVLREQDKYFLAEAWGLQEDPKFIEQVQRFLDRAPQEQVEENALIAVLLKEYLPDRMLANQRATLLKLLNTVYQSVPLVGDYVEVVSAATKSVDDFSRQQPVLRDHMADYCIPEPLHSPLGNEVLSLALYRLASTKAEELRYEGRQDLEIETYEDAATKMLGIRMKLR